MPKKNSKSNESLDAVIELSAAEARKRMEAYYKFINKDWSSIKSDSKLKNGNSLYAIFDAMKEAATESDTSFNTAEVNEMYFIINETDKLLKGKKKALSKPEAFKILKSGYLNGLVTKDFENVKNHLHNRYNPIDPMLYEEGLLNEIDKLLTSGDNALRGSSKAYKEIQREVKDLKTTLDNWGMSIKEDPAKKRYMETMVRALIEKAQDYILDRTSVAMKYSVTSYKGKRVNVMRNVLNRLVNAKNHFEAKHLYTENDPKHILSNEYKTMIRNKLCNGSFNKVLFSEYMGTRDQNVNIEKAMINHNFYMNDDATITMKKALKDKLFGSKTLRTMWNKVKRIFEAAKSNIDAAKNEDELDNLNDAYNTNRKKLNEMKEDVYSPAYVMDRAFYSNPEYYTGKDIGDYDLDMLVLEKVNTMYEKANAELQPVNNQNPQVNLPA